VKHRPVILLTLSLMLAGCASGLDLINSLKLEEGELGSVCVRGNIDVNPSPFITSRVAFVYKEHSEGEESPEC